VKPKDLLDLFRSEIDDRVEPFLWSDEDVLGYMDDAQKMFCRLTDGIADASTACVAQLQVDASTTWLDTHPSILKFRSLKRADTGRPVAVLNEEEMADHGMYFDGTTGPVRALIVGMEANRARVWPDSSEAVTLQAMVFRLPIKPLDEGFEVAQEHRRHLLHWVKSLAYLKHDAETYDKTKSAEFEAKFRAYCAQVKEEERRKRHKPRTMAYGGL
jgi:hypothetical protein